MSPPVVQDGYYISIIFPSRHLYLYFIYTHLYFNALIQILSVFCFVPVLPTLLAPSTTIFTVLLGTQSSSGYSGMGTSRKLPDPPLVMVLGAESPVRRIELLSALGSASCSVGENNPSAPGRGSRNNHSNIPITSHNNPSELQRNPGAGLVQLPLHSGRKGFSLRCNISKYVLKVLPRARTKFPRLSVCVQRCARADSSSLLGAHGA